MIPTWAVRFPRADVEEADRLWPIAQVEVCDQDGHVVWFRGDELSEPVDLILRGFLSGQRFQVLPDGQLRSPQARVPQGHLPKGPWMPLRKWIQIELPVAALSGELVERMALRIVPADASPRESNLLLTDAATWRSYALEAPELRLDPLRFACDATGRVIVHGVPLPPVPGKRFVVYDGIAVVAGWSWEPAVPTTIVRRLCHLQPDDLALFFEDSHWERICRSDFVAANRQSVRESIGLTP